MTATSAAPFLRHAGIELPIIGGAMYPCSNPELVAAVSESDGIGIIQPISLTYVHGHDFRGGIRLIRSLTSRPIGMNALIESYSKKYHERMRSWLEIAIEEGVRFVVTSLGNPRWVCELVHSAGGVVYHDVTERKWAEKALAGGVDGLIAVNNRAGGHAGSLSLERLIDEVGGLGVPVIAAGGIATPAQFSSAMQLGYAGIQMGTRFIATKECSSSEAYKQAIVRAQAADIVLSEKLTGVPVAVINTPYIARMGLTAGPLARWMLRGRRTRHWMRTFYALNSVWKLKRSALSESPSSDYWQAGKSAGDIDSVVPVADIMNQFRIEYQSRGSPPPPPTSP